MTNKVSFDQSILGTGDICLTRWLPVLCEVCNGPNVALKIIKLYIFKVSSIMNLGFFSSITPKVVIRPLPYKTPVFASCQS